MDVAFFYLITNKTKGMRFEAKWVEYSEACTYCRTVM